MMTRSRSASSQKVTGRESMGTTVNGDLPMSEERQPAGKDFTFTVEVVPAQQAVAHAATKPAAIASQQQQQQQQGSAAYMDVSASGGGGGDGFESSDEEV